ncbi:tetratricopeptide repeat protein [Aquisphaera giovannonii]|uniref:Tetratricopeptide repeat protein n=1 Tax=Aquisphaera giovannonii TaxID=406548 RepID=A0A5B9W177_9BACT|nr:tetratricopeptide repeat protein [Aquisphaera giovannonii]QEH34313.1 tetratricopeptide repeat protein [Aquisphaera giovannonii]
MVNRKPISSRRILAAACLAAMGIAGVLVARGEPWAFLAARAARAAFAAGRSEDAAGPLQRWLDLRPNSAEANFLMARSRFAAGRVAEARRSLDRAEDLGYPARPVYRLKALLLTRAGMFAEAEPILLNLLNESDEPDPELDEALTRVYLETYRLELAAKVIRRWMLDAPKDAKPYLWLTEVDSRLEVDNPGVEERHYRDALALDPGLDKARLGLARSLAKLHRDEEAIAEYEAYLAANPSDPAGLLGLGEIRLNRGELDQARSLVGRALEIEPANPVAAKQLAALEVRRGDLPAALEHLTAAIKGDPLDVDALYQRMLTYSRLGRRSEAEDDRRRLDALRADQVAVVKLRDHLLADPSNVELRLEMASWMLQHGRDDQAIRWLRNILASQPRHPKASRLMADYHERRGELGLANHYRLLGETAQAGP